jgi:hypothetical protein
MANFRKTRPEFGNVEAYARRHRRIVPVLGTTIQLSLQQAERATPLGSLKRLVDGSAFNMELLSTVVPSLRGLGVSKVGCRSGLRTYHHRRRH